jgi:hypothetical protein
MIKTTSYAERIKTQTGKYIVLVKGVRDQRRCWYYVMSDKVKMPILIRKCNNQEPNLNVESFGSIIKAGWGEEPPAYIQDKIEREGANYDESEFAVPEGNTDKIFEVTSTDAQGRKFFVRIRVYGHFEKEFLKVVNYGSCDIGAYGIVEESRFLEDE